MESHNPPISNPAESEAPRRPRSRPLRLARFGMVFLSASVVSGVLLAGLTLPLVGGAGLTAQRTAQSFDDIPDDFKTPPLTQATLIYDAKGGQIAKVYARDRTVIAAEQMSPLMRHAQVDIEDARFYEHGAVDLKGIARALGKNAETGTNSQGASTLTQQYVKNVNVEIAGDDKDAVREAQRKTLGRKIQELKIAIKLDKEMPKDQILTNYLNITYYGNGAYGVEAASQRYFGKADKDVTVAEAATLAGIVQNPSQYDPVRYPEATVKRRNVVIDKMLENKHLTDAQAKEAKAAPLGLNYHGPQNGCITAQAGMGFFCDYVKHVVKQDPAFGKSAEERAKLWNTGGLKIYTTLDPDKQAAAQSAVSDNVRITDSVSAATTMIEPGTGKILAMAQTRPYGLDKSRNQTTVNLNADLAMGGGTGFQPGSTFKPIVAAAALETGLPATREYPSPNRIEYPDMRTCDGTWRNDARPKTVVPNESANEKGPYQLKEAMARSINTYFVQMEQEIGLCAVKQMANKFGITTMASGKPLKEVPAMGLGVEEMSPLTMANVYATFAAGGTHCAPLAIDRITTVDGKNVPVPAGHCEKVISDETSQAINTILNGVTVDGTGSALKLDGNRQIAGKTGTSDRKKAAWFSGYTPQLAASVWLGGPDGGVEMRDITINGKHHDEVFGADGPGPIWRDAMNEALKGAPRQTLPMADIPDPAPRPDPNATGTGTATTGPATGAPPTTPSGRR